MNKLINKRFLSLDYDIMYRLFNINMLYQLLVAIFVILCLNLFIMPETPLCQFPTIPPVSYYYTNPLFFPSYGYINSISDPFYYLGYGYKPPIKGDSLLGWNLFSPFLNAYSSYLYNFFEITTYGYSNSPYQTAFPYKTLPGTGYPYSRFVYPSYSYGSADFYKSWVNFQ